MMDRRDDWPDRILEDDLDPGEGLDPAGRRSAERIARDARNMDAVLTTMANRLSERLPPPIHAKGAPQGRRPTMRWRMVAPVAAAAAVVAALVLVRGEGIDQNEGPESSAGAPRPTSMMAEMDVEADRPFVVFPTNNPDIAVVWLLHPEGTDR